LATTGMTIGGARCGSQVVDAVLATNSASLLGMLTLLATRDDAQVTFSGTSSTFNAMAVQADNGVLVQADASTVVGVLYLDADSDDNSTTDVPNQIQFAAGITVLAKTLLTLESTQDKLVRAGSPLI
jgi:hypothetical protein